MKLLFKKKETEQLKEEKKMFIVGRHPTATNPGSIGTMVKETRHSYIVQYPEGNNAAISKLCMGKPGDHIPYVVFKNYSELRTMYEELATLENTMYKMKGMGE